MSKINFNDKVENGGTTLDGKLSALNINEIKLSVNDLYDSVDSLSTSITGLENSSGDLSNSITSLETSVNGLLTSTSGISITNSQLLTLISNSQLSTNEVYKITDSYHGGYVYVKSLSNNSIDPNGVWIKDFTCKAYGAITIDSSTGGSVDTITVDGINQMSASVSFATDNRTTCANVCANINANSSGSVLYKAVQCDTTIVLVAKTGGTAFNSKTVAGTSTGLNLISAYPTRYGQDVITKTLSVLYNYNIDRFYRAKDEKNNIMEVVLAQSDTIDTYNEFRWTDTRTISENYISYKLHYDVYLYGDSAIFSTNKFVGNSYARGVFVAGNTTTAMSGINAYIGSSITNFSYTNTTGSANFSNIVMTQLSSITNISLKATGATASFSQLQLLGTFSTITTLDIKGQFVFQYLTLSNYFVSIKNITSSAGAISMTRNVLSGYSSSIEALTNTGAGSFGVQSCNLTGAFSSIKNIAWTTTSGTSYILGCNLSGFTTLISGTASGSAVTCQYVNLIGSNSQFNFNSNGQATVVFQYINISVGAGVLSGVTASSDFKTIGNIDWSEQGYSFSYTTPTLNNTTNRGLVNSIITLGYVPNKWYPSSFEIEGASLASTSGTLKIGIDTDDDSALLASTTTTSLNSVITTPTVTKTKATALRKITATPLTTGITAGTFRIVLNGKIGI